MACHVSANTHSLAVARDRIDEIDAQLAALAISARKLEFEKLSLKSTSPPSYTLF
jgi:hypothetical protein